MREGARATARAAASIVGTLPGAALTAAAVAASWPGDPSVGHAVGFASTLPLWVAAMTVAFLDDRAWRAALVGVAWAALAMGALTLT